MHIDFSKSVNSDYFTKLDDEISEKCTAFAKSVYKLGSGKKYLLETGEANPYWKSLCHFKFIPCVKAITHCGIVFRGDSRNPEIIFKQGFKSIHHPDIESENDFFGVALEAELEPRQCSISRETLVPNQKNMVCCTKDPYVAAYFPSLEAGASTYVYCCYVNSGIKIFETIAGLENRWLETSMAISAQEVITPIIPAEHVVCAWMVRRIKLEGECEVMFKSEYIELKTNQNVDFCVKEYLKHTSIPEPDKSSKIVKVYSNGKVEVECA